MTDAQDFKALFISTRASHLQEMYNRLYDQYSCDCVMFHFKYLVVKLMPKHV